MYVKIVDDNLKDLIRKGIECLFQGEIEKLEIDCYSPSKIFKIIKSMGIEIDEDEFETNGWQYDYWQNITHNNKKYVIHGSGYYGNLTIEENLEE